MLSPQAFELATGDYLFEPHSGEDYSRDEGIVGTDSPVTPAQNLAVLHNSYCFFERMLHS